MELQPVPHIFIDPKVEIDIILRELYYKPYGYYQTAEELLSVAKEKSDRNIKIDDVRRFLYKQAVWQIHAPKPKYIPRASFTSICIPNEVHQADLLEMPRDTKEGKIYKYCLCVIDIASRYKAAIPLTNKLAITTARAFKKIYNARNCPLVWPKLLQVDGGSEFKGDVITLMNNHDVRIRVGKTKRSQSLVERFNGLLQRKSFRYQDACELLLPPHEYSRAWKDNLPSVIKYLNNNTTRMIGMKPSVAITMKKIKAKPSKPARRPIGLNEKCLPLYLNVRYLLDEGELVVGRRRITDLNWSPQIHKIMSALVQDKEPILYRLDGLDRTFVREELMPIGEVELPPRNILNQS
jgi:hypothetical protein